MALRIASVPAVAAFVLLGVWVTGGLLTDDFETSIALTTLFFALTTARSWATRSARSAPQLGRHAFIRHAGHAAAQAELVRDLYAAAAPAWVEAGVRRHLCLVPALDDLVDAWFRVGFGHMHVHAIRESGADERPPPDGVVIREGATKISPGCGCSCS